MRKLLVEKLLLSIGLLLFGQAAYADNQCPNGQFNPNQSVCMCPNGGYVGPGERCSGGGGSGKSYLQPAWGAIAIDVSPKQANSGWGYSEESQAAANKDALETCGLAECKVVVTVKNSCAAVAGGENGVWGSGVDVDKDLARKKSGDACYAKGGKVCYYWVKPRCANAPR